VAAVVGSVGVVVVVGNVVGSGAVVVTGRVVAVRGCVVVCAVEVGVGEGATGAVVGVRWDRTGIVASRPPELS